MAAGARNTGVSGGSHGVAWNANLAVYAVPLESRDPDAKYAPSTPGGDVSLSEWFSPGIDADVDFMNMSFGAWGLIENYTETALRNALGTSIATLAQAGATDKTVLVWSAGNSHGEECAANSTAPECKTDPNNAARKIVDATSPSFFSGMMLRISELRGHSIAVVSVGSNGVISSFSNRCGIAADWCIAAPGGNILAPYFGPSASDPGRGGAAL